MIAPLVWPDTPVSSALCEPFKWTISSPPMSLAHQPVPIQLDHMTLDAFIHPRHGVRKPYLHVTVLWLKSAKFEVLGFIAASQFYRAVTSNIADQIVWRNQFTRQLPPGLFSGKAAALRDFDFYNTQPDWLTEYCVSDVERGIALRFEAFRFVNALFSAPRQKPESKMPQHKNWTFWWERLDRITLPSDPSVMDFIFLQNETAYRLDTIGFAACASFACMHGINGRLVSDTVQFADEWSHNETKLATLRLKTCWAGHGFIFWNRIKPNAGLSSPENPRALTQSEIQRLTEFDPSVGTWTRLPFECAFELIGQRRVLLLNGFVYLSDSHLDSCIRQEFVTQLKRRLNATRAHQGIGTRITGQEAVLYKQWLTYSNQLHLIGAGGLGGSKSNGKNSILPAGQSAMSFLKSEDRRIPSCIQHMHKQAHLDHHERCVYTNFMVRLGARTPEIMKHWDRGFRAHFLRSKSQSASSTSDKFKAVDSELRAVRKEVEHIEKKRNLYAYSCLNVITKGKCPMLHQSGGEQAISACRKSVGIENNAGKKFKRARGPFEMLVLALE